MDKSTDEKIVLDDFYNVGVLAGQALNSYEKLTGSTFTKIIIIMSLVNVSLIAWLITIL